MNKLEKLFNGWINSHPNIRGTGRYSLRYSSKKFRTNLVPNYLEKYYVSPKGKVYKRTHKNSIFWKEVTYYISVDALDNRTPHACIRIKISSKLTSLSRIVAKVWVSNPNSLPIVMHLDNNKFNNSYLNLQWGTQSQNISQARDEGRLPTLFVSGPSNPSFGKRMSPLSLEDEKSIVNDVMSGKFTKVQIAKNYGISRSCINPILRRNGYGKF